ncbi:MAG TPA: radical SAM protein [Ornithinimicrobium sp.]|uniref:radical SAM protein n=1 Tax=Ornithinimicrobium sp. TaxID=1977084 RepID=UPI002B48BF4B|nr:radical SAM protein [Ornithinimicrobium sp.]HKJ11112.1 radical SAM protein [Ornithinimicrobium sp.]
MTTSAAPSVPEGLGDVARLVDGGEMDCGSGLLLLITRAMRRLSEGELLGIRSAEHSVTIDLPVWADLVGHQLDAEVAESESGPWWFAVRKSAKVSTVFSLGERTPVGHRLWAYTNFNCNLACVYCCAESSPKAAARHLDPEVAREAFAEFADSGGKELFLTGGEPFMHPQLDELVRAGEGLERTILTNAMIFGRGRRRQMLEEMDRSVILQVSLDSATADLHDAQRGAGSWAKAMVGIGQAHELGFRVRIAATLFDEDPTAVGELHSALDEIGIDKQDRVIRPVAAEGFADAGVHVSIDNLEPEPTITADGAWWHPVAVTNPHMRIHDAPLPLSEVFGVVRDTLEVQDAASRTGREVFRCA